MAELFFYPWYVDRWRSSEARMQMNSAERGVYRELLDYVYQHGSLPADTVALARISGIPSREFKRSWPRVSQWFVKSGDRLQHFAADEVRSALLQSITRRRERGVKGGRARWHKQSVSSDASNAHAEAQAEVKQSLKHGASNGASSAYAVLSDMPTRCLADGNTHNLNTKKRAVPAAPSSLEENPSVGSPLRTAKNRKKNREKKPETQTSAPHSRGKAPVRRSSDETSETSRHDEKRATRIVSLHGDHCELELEGRNGREIRSMPLAEAEQLLAHAKGVAP